MSRWTIKNCIFQANWLENPSFDKEELKKAEPESGVVSSPEPESLAVTKRKHKKEHKAKKAKKKKKSEESPAQPVVSTNDHYYVDKNAVRGYLSVETLYRPACPKYSIFARGLQTKSFFKASSKTYKRYFSTLKKSEKQSKERSLEDISLDDEKFRKALFDDPTQVSKWLEYYNYKVQNPTEMEKFKNDQIQFNVLEKAMKHNSKDDRIVKPFLNAAKKIYPNDTLLEIIDGLLEKDPNNFLLWKSFIYFRQGCMSQCMVPDILQIFEKSMRTCFSLKDDVIMLSMGR
jgi:NRDE-2, necessary for RNA interference